MFGLPHGVPVPIHGQHVGVGRGGDGGAGPQDVFRISERLGGGNQEEALTMVVSLALEPGWVFHPGPTTSS